MERIKELVKILNEASDAYYNQDIEIMSNFEYDALYDELVELEKQTGIIFENSPTQKAGYEVVSKLEKTEHEYPALSLDKTKDREYLKGWLNDKDAVLSWKMDGLTLVATYENGQLVKAATRGNGYVGEIVTHNARHFKGLPRKISYKGKLIVRGEAVMKYKDFENINNSLPETLSKYKNPRNLASSTVRLLDSNESKNRPIHFYAFDLTYCDDESVVSDFNLKSSQFEWLKSLSFNVVDYMIVNKDTILGGISAFENRLKANEFPSDGLVLIFNDEAYGKSLGMTGKFPRSGIAFKWKDEEVETVLRKVEWSASRTGLLNPVAIFDPVEIEGTTVSRASVHNLSIARDMMLGEGSIVSVFKANLIIPQIAKTIKSAGPTEVPEKCPVCGGSVVVNKNDDIETLYCANDKCPAKNVGILTHFTERNSMNIDGLSSATLEKFVDMGWIKSFSDIYHLSDHKEEITTMDGFGEKSYEKIINAIEKSRKCTFSSLLTALGIPGVGKDMAKTISKYLGNAPVDALKKILSARLGFASIDGVGDIVSENISVWFRENEDEFNKLLAELEISPDASDTKENSNITGKTFVITGNLTTYKNRNELVSVIESYNGHVAGSVSKKTDYLINNDNLSQSSKNKKAKELGVIIITEEEFNNLIK